MPFDVRNLLCVPREANPVSLCALDVSNRQREHKHVSNTSTRTQTRTRTCRVLFRLKLLEFSYRGGIPITKPERLREEHTNGGVVRASTREL